MKSSTGGTSPDALMPSREIAGILPLQGLKERRLPMRKPSTSPRWRKVSLLQRFFSSSCLLIKRGLRHSHAKRSSLPIVVGDLRLSHEIIHAISGPRSFGMSTDQPVQLSKSDWGKAAGITGHVLRQGYDTCRFELGKFARLQRIEHSDFMDMRRES